MGFLAKMYLTFFNVAVIIAGLAVIAAGLVMKFDGKVKCLAFLTWYIVGLGAAILTLSFLGTVGMYRKKIYYPYVFLMFIAVVILCLLIVFSIVVTRAGHGHSVPGRNYDEYRVGDYSRWLQKRVNESDNWRKAEKCLRSMKMCTDVRMALTTEEKFNSAHLSALESGCCKPPDSCGFTYQNATLWNAPPNASEECKKWSNDQTKLCFDCNSCKAGVLQTFKDTWSVVACVLILVWILLVLAYVASVYQFIRNHMNNRKRLTQGIPMYNSSRHQNS